MKAFLLDWVSFITHPTTTLQFILLFSSSALEDCSASPNPPKEDGTIGPGGLLCSLGALRGKKKSGWGKEVSTLGTQETGPGPVGSPLPGPPAKCPTGNFTSEMRDSATLGGEPTSQTRACLQI